MNRLVKKMQNRALRANRVRKLARGSAERPRLSVHISLNHISAQIIDDSTGRTLAAASTIGQKSSGSMTEKAALVGADIAAKAKTAKIKQVVFDRGGKLYHGRVAALADGARQAGLEF
ncbi:MAG TPA: 50S ribosomal protein L18 [Candidatus Saccharimonadales bacterium]|nr:50S ribosomal protein L18 [Candidatus Saccharimonadales bacterium]